LKWVELFSENIFVFETFFWENICFGEFFSNFFLKNLFFRISYGTFFVMDCNVKLVMQF